MQDSNENGWNFTGYGTVGLVDKGLTTEVKRQMFQYLTSAKF